jgi:hypothetical protein
MTIKEFQESVTQNRRSNKSHIPHQHHPR